MAKIVKPKAKAVAAKVKAVKTEKNPLVGTTWIDQGTQKVVCYILKFYSSDKVLVSRIRASGTEKPERLDYTFKNGRIEITADSGRSWFGSYKVNRDTLQEEGCARIYKKIG